MRRVVRICLLGLVLVLTVSGTALAEYSGPYYTDVAFGNLGVGAGSISEFSPEVRTKTWTRNETGGCPCTHSKTV